MKIKHALKFAAALLWFTLVGLQPSTAFAQGMVFSDQGRLNNDANPANGSGAFSYTEANAPLFPMRFYFVLSP